METAYIFLLGNAHECEETHLLGEQLIVHLQLLLHELGVFRNEFLIVLLKVAFLDSKII